MTHGTITTPKFSSFLKVAIEGKDANVVVKKKKAAGLVHKVLEEVTSRRGFRGHGRNDAVEEHQSGGCR